MRVGAAADAEAAELALAADIEDELRRHIGGALSANFLFLVRPDFRKRLGDVKLLSFIKKFPERFEVRADLRGGHVLRSQAIEEPEKVLPQDRAVGVAEPGATLPGRHLACNERAVHALRQLERELVRSLAPQARPTSVDFPAGCHGPSTAGGEGQLSGGPDAGGGARAVGWLLHNGRLRRKIGALLRFLPVDGLHVHSNGPGANPGNGQIVDDAANDDGATVSEAAKAEEAATRPQCPLTAHGRTLAGYLLQFMRDRPEVFLLEPVGPAQPEEEGRGAASPPRRRSGGGPGCAYGDPGCPCRLRAALAAGARRAAALPGEDTELLSLVARKVTDMCSLTGSARAPIVRIGRDPEVHAILRGRSLLQLLQQDGDRCAARGVAPRFSLDPGGSNFFTVALSGKEEGRGGCCAGDADGDGVPEAPRPPRQPRRARRPATAAVQVLGRGEGVIAVLKPPGVTTEALLEGLRALLEAEAAQDQRVISVSRLDRDTSGVLVAATSPSGADCLTAQFKEHQVFKRYLAVCTGHLHPRVGEVRARLYMSGFSESYRSYVSPKGKEACTKYEVLQYLSQGAPTDPPPPAAAPDELSAALRRYGGAAASGAASAAGGGCGTGAGAAGLSLVACYPLTGRTHQIRAHLAWRGHPLVADTIYNPRGQMRRHFAWCPRLWLHCERMRLRDLSGQELEFQAPLCEDLQKALDSVGGG